MLIKLKHSKIAIVFNNSIPTHISIVKINKQYILFLLFNYEIKSIILTGPDFIKDLGVILDRKLSFNNHIDAIISKSMAMLGF